MLMNRKLYPANWNSIALQIKIEANWICQECSRLCRQVGEILPNFIERIEGWNHSDLDWVSETAISTICDNLTRFVLTVAYLDHDPWNSTAQLKALCEQPIFAMCYVGAQVIPEHPEGDRAKSSKKAAGARL